MLLVRLAWDVAGRGYPGAWGMTPAKLRFVHELLTERDRQALRDRAYAGRVAQADEKAWKAFIETTQE